MITIPAATKSPKQAETDEQAERDQELAFRGPARAVRVKIEAVAELPTRFGHFRVVAFWNNQDGKEHLALVRGEILGAEDVPTRLHSECLTGDVLGSFRCDCRDQLEAAMLELGTCDKGLLLYMRQEGRGIGFANKIRAYALQERGLDTVDANRTLGFRDDERDYAVAAQMVKCLAPQSIALMTNNPDKVEQLRKYGVSVSRRVPHVMPANQYNRAYLKTKALRSGHVIDFE